MIGPTDRGGFTPLANAEAERLFNELTPEQFRLYVGLRIEAQYAEPCERRDAFGRRVALEPGEVLFGIDSTAARYGLNRDQVRRAVERFEQLGFLTRRAGVAAAIPPTVEAATPRGREAATPPTVLTFATDREKCWRGKRTATPPDAAPATPHDPVATPIQHRTTETETIAAARAREGARPAARSCGPVVDDLSRSPLEIVDLAGDHPTPPPTPGEVFRRRLAERLARTAPHPWGGGSEVHDSIARALGVIPLEEAVEFVAARVADDVAARRPQPRTMKLLAAMLAEEVTRRRAPARRAEPAPWAAIMATHDALPPAEQRPGIHDLRKRCTDGVVELLAAEPLEAAFLAEVWLPGVTKLAALALGPEVKVRVAVQPLVAGGAR